MTVLYSGNLTGTATLPELVWFLIGVLGLAVSFANLRDCWRDMAYIEASGQNGLLWLAATSNTREEFLRVLKSVVICAIGLAAMRQPPANAVVPVSALAVIVTVGLFTLGVLVVAGSLRARRDRARLRTYQPATKEETP